jgi:hypothetical protein
VGGGVIRGDAWGGGVVDDDDAAAAAEAAASGASLPSTAGGTPGRSTCSGGGGGGGIISSIREVALHCPDEVTAGRLRDALAAAAGENAKRVGGGAFVS